MNRLILLDNTVLTNLALLQQTELVFRLWSEDACTTPAVMLEYQAGARQAKFGAESWRKLRIIELTEPETYWANALPPRLGAGEKTCLAVALHRLGVFASDDFDARAAARRSGIALTGTLGILLLSIERGDISLQQGSAFLKVLIAAGYRSPVQELDGFLKK